MDHEQSVVIAGGGYSGVLAANRAHGRLRGRARVVLIAPGDSLIERIRLHEAAAHGTDVRRRYDTLLARGIEHIDGRVVGLDVATNTLSLAVGPTSRELRYTALVLAFGSRMTRTVAGHSTHADALADLASAQRLGAALPGLAPRSRVLVVGGGLTAIELSAELAETYPQLQIEMLASEFASGLAGPAADALRTGLTALNVIVRENVRVAALDRAGALLADGSRIDAAVSIRACGFEPAPLGPDFGLATTAAGRVAVTPQLLAAGTSDVFVVGDLAAPPLAADGRTTRMACATAMPLGAHAGDQVARLLSGDALQPYRFGYVLQCISLGRRSGVVVFVDSDDRPTGRVVTGRTAALVKELICRFTIGSLKLERLIAGAYAWPQPARVSRPGELPT